MSDITKTVAGVFIALVLYGWYRKGGFKGIASGAQGLLGSASPAGVSLTPHQIADSSMGASSVSGNSGCGCGGGGLVQTLSQPKSTFSGSGSYAIMTPIA